MLHLDIVSHREKKVCPAPVLFTQGWKICGKNTQEQEIMFISILSTKAWYLCVMLGS